MGDERGTTDAPVRIPRWRYVARTRITGHPLYIAYARRSRHRHKTLDDRTDLVIEGFPRSGNTFAVAAFQMAQPGPVRVGHHLHAPAHVIAAARAGVPCLVLIRDPDDAVVSEAIRLPNVGIGPALARYCRFYSRILPHRGGYVVAGFDEITTDFGSTISRLNERFGTSFRPFDHTDENVKACFELIEAHWRNARSEAMVPRPSEERDSMKREVTARLQDERFARLRARARALFEAFAEQSRRSRATP